ncbi:retropepsin-like aspartic protease [Flavobacterium frigidarium]|uniref:retropepsin-like aspartic protease n=1 Tax=Flavobacterium frigidarium TaxID=99286 RepID=UPI00040890B0|nr:aspartyl protease family protein [Flavobacterium frigidarium]
MRLLAFIVLLFFIKSSSQAQSDFVFKNENKQVTIPFQLIDNLIFIPLLVNGIELTFLVDSGVEETVLFSLEDKAVELKNRKTIRLVGLGSKEEVEGLKSVGNTIETKNFRSTNHLVYVILNQDFNLSSHVGIPVNGIIGYSLLKKHLIEINYKKKKIFVYNENSKIKKKLARRYTQVPLSIEASKPYVYANIALNNEITPVKLLVDLGNSDALWLFHDTESKMQVPNKNFDDYLGQGFSGDITGKRARITGFEIAGFQFNKPVVAFPDSVSTKHVKIVADRKGSIGGEIFKRFKVVFDYSNNNMYLKKSGNFNLPFFYNKSGIEIKHIGMEWVEETVNLKFESATSRYKTIKSDDSNYRIKFTLKPIYVVSGFRPNSPAANSGLIKGDILVRINGKKINHYSLKELSSLIKTHKEKWLVVEVSRNNQLYKITLELKDLL